MGFESKNADFGLARDHGGARLLFAALVVGLGQSVGEIGLAFGEIGLAFGEIGLAFGEIGLFAVGHGGPSLQRGMCYFLGLRGILGHLEVWQKGEACAGLSSNRRRPSR
jgi:hypothetical protein